MSARVRSTCGDLLQHSWQQLRQIGTQSTAHQAAAWHRCYSAHWTGTIIFRPSWVIDPKLFPYLETWWHRGSTAIFQVRASRARGDRRSIFHWHGTTRRMTRVSLMQHFVWHFDLFHSCLVISTACWPFTRHPSRPRARTFQWKLCVLTIVWHLQLTPRQVRRLEARTLTRLRRLGLTPPKHTLTASNDVLQWTVFDTCHLATNITALDPSSHYSPAVQARHWHVSHQNRPGS